MSETAPETITNPGSLNRYAAEHPEVSDRELTGAYTRELAVYKHSVVEEPERPMRGVLDYLSPAIVRPIKQDN